MENKRLEKVIKDVLNNQDFKGIGYWVDMDYEDDETYSQVFEFPFNEIEYLSERNFPKLKTIKRNYEEAVVDTISSNEDLEGMETINDLIEAGYEEEVYDETADYSILLKIEFTEDEIDEVLRIKASLTTGLDFERPFAVALTDKIKLTNSRVMKKEIEKFFEYLEDRLIK